MERVISLSLGEVVLKGKNRKYFVNRIISQVKKAITHIGYSEITKDMGKIYIKCDYNNFNEIIKELQYIFGIVYISPCIKVEKNIEDISEAIKTLLSEYLEKNPNSLTFKCESSRADKSFKLNSLELNKVLGGVVLRNFENLKVDVHNPDLKVYCDIKEQAYIYIERFKAYGGLPIGTNGKGLLLLSGGIDSPVAGFLMAKRGVQVDALHFHSYPFTSERAEQKVFDLAKILSKYTGDMKIYSVNLLNIQKEINKNCPEREMTIISRRFMMRIAERISEKNGYLSLITGENLGQVASQTINGIIVTNNSTNMLVMRPLIGLDKVDIIDWAKRIGTYETSIMPFEDCCTVFLPKHPVLKPTIEEIEDSEKILNVEEMVNKAVDDMKIIEIKEGEIL